MAESLSERAYSITKSYHRINSALIWTIAFALAVCFAIFVSGLLRLNIQIDEMGLGREFAGVTLGLYTQFGGLVVILSFSLVLVALRGRKKYKELKEWGEDYLYGAYVLNFATSVPKGELTGEKIFSIAKYVFPELRRLKKESDVENEDEILKRSLNRSFGSRVYDLALRTESGYFLVKHLGHNTITLDELKGLAHSSARDFGRNKIFRMVCVARSYDPVFFDLDELEKQIRKIGSTLPIDVLVEEEKGYSVLRVASSV